MKLYFAILLIALKSALGFTQVADFHFYKTTHKFQRVKAGETLTHYYVFTNKGNAPLIISEYEVACHCTKIDFPKYPIQPNATDSIRLTFDTKGKYGTQDREIVLFSNAKRKETSLRFKVYVEGKKD